MNERDEGPISQSHADEVPVESRWGHVWDRFYDSIPWVFFVFFSLLLVLSVLPPVEGILSRLGNLFVIGGTACIASGVILNAKLVRHSAKIVEQQSLNPQRLVTRAELVEIVGGIVSDMQQRRTLSDVQEDFYRRMGDDQLPEGDIYTISVKNMAQGLLKSSSRTYIGSTLIIAGTIFLSLEQFSRVFSVASSFFSTISDRLF
ncbi:hypothetical protein ABFU38_12960 [Xanthomonas campestris pv. raphani]|uniref:hypothetical protein n=1 Tax=Xanthomonas campestris TaxID=339 RepID=UPI0038907AFC